MIEERLSMKLFKSREPEIPFDPVAQYAVIRSSICTGEKVAGFVNREDRKFTDVMLIRNDADIEKFKEMYGLTEIKTEY